MLKFDAGSFSDLSETPQGRDVWAFLNTEKSFACLETTTFLQRPALEGIQPKLLQEFGDKIKPDRWKQLMGRMVRQIMESRGYTLDQTSVRIKTGSLFTSAARYKELDRSKI